jgi:hypothetical protein
VPADERPKQFDQAPRLRIIPWHKPILKLAKTPGDRVSCW